MHDWSWALISADINTVTVPTTTDTKLPKVNVYFEDKEASDLCAALMVRQPIKKFMRPLPDVTLGCSNYLNLIRAGVRDFSEKGLVCLDADAAHLLRNKHPDTVVLLPGSLPPDQLIFEHLYNLPADDAFGQNGLLFSRDVFTRCGADVIRELRITGDTVDVKVRVDAYPENKNPRPRELFKRFYNQPEFQKLIASNAQNPWKHWIAANPEASNEFLSKIKTALHGVMKNGYAVDTGKLTALEVKLKTV